MHWLFYAFIVIFGASGMHIFSRMAKGVIHPLNAALIGSGIFFVITLAFLLFSPSARSEVLHLNFMSILPALLMGLALSAVNIAIFYVYDAGAPLSIAVPFIRVCGALIAVLVGLLFFAEKLSLIQASGVILALVGIVVMSL